MDRYVALRGVENNSVKYFKDGEAEKETSFKFGESNMMSQQFKIRKPKDVLTRTVFNPAPLRLRKAQKENITAD